MQVHNTEIMQAQTKTPTVESDPLEGVPQIDESTVETLSEQVAEDLKTLSFALSSRLTRSEKSIQQS